MTYKLVIASYTGADKFAQAPAQEGLRPELDYLKDDPLAKEQCKGARGYDHVHLSTLNRESRLVQWHGRAQNGYHYPIGQVMKMKKVRERKS